ncbi:MAG: helix-turn-helix domain-containing protein [Myxococcales bacterium]|nr:helix-turn-helix domain-containing protein [Myxococcales bacterium]
MKGLADQNHYEILETHLGATLEEIDRAYQLALVTYADDSLARYSVFGEREVSVLRERIESAYDVLKNADSRRTYDSKLPEEDHALAPADAPPQGSEAPAMAPGFEDLDEESGEFDGPRLRRTRLRRGIEIDNIASITKINPLYLRFIEDERFLDLPAAVYVRGFVCEFARCLGLDPQRVAVSFMRRFEESRSEALSRRAGRKRRSRG